MKLRALRVNQFGKFVSPAGVLGLEDGLNLLIAPNEAGKSTLVRALKMALFEKHGLSGSEVLKVQNAGSQAAPVVELSFELPDGRYTLRKRFIGKPYARLSLPDGATLEGEAAEAKLRSLFNFTRPVKGAIRAKDLGLWSLLWVEQGDALKALEVHDLAQATVREALESTVGSVLGGTQGRQLPAVVRADLDALLTSGQKKPRGAFRAALERQIDLEQKLESLESRRRELEASLDTLEQVRRQLRDIEEGGQESELREKLATASAKKSELASLELEIRSAESDRELKLEHRRQVQQQLSERSALLESLAAGKAAFAAAREELAGIDEEEARLASRVVQDKERREACRAARVAAERRLQQVGDRLRAAQLTMEIEGLRTRIDKADAVAKEIERLKAEVEGNRVTEDRLDAIDEAHTEMERERAAASSSATLLSFSLQPGAAGKVTVNDKPLIEGAPVLEIMEAVGVEIAGIGRLAINPQVHDAETRRLHLEDAQRIFREALAEAGVADPLEARERARARSASKAAYDSGRRELDALLVDHGGSLEGLVRHCAAQQRTMSRLSAQSVAEALPDIESASGSRERAELEYREALAAEDAAQKALERQLDALERHRNESQVQRSRAVTLENDVGRFSAELRVCASEEELRARQNTRNEELEAVDSRLALLRERAGGESSTMLDQRIRRFEQSLANLRDKISALNDARIKAETKLETEGASGIGEDIARNERELEFARVEAQRHEREAEVLTLLSETLAEAEQEMNDRFMGPIVAKIRPYLSMLFPGVSLSLDESLAVRAINREGDASPDFEMLSRGTQEQINVLTRIAIAELMAEQGRPAMLVLDDVFAWSDDQRLDRIFDALTMAAKHVQILLLSCRDSAFSGAGGHVLQIVPVEEGDLQSA